MKQIITTFFFLFLPYLSGSAQIIENEFERIILNTHLPDQLNLPSGAKELLKSKLDKITTEYGLGGSQVNPRFIITANVNEISKNILATTPTMISVQIAINIIIGDAIDNIKFSNLTLSLNGSDINENKAYINAVQSINPTSKSIKIFIEESKLKITNYYLNNCHNIITEAQTLALQEKYDEAIYKLSIVPKACQQCYLMCQDTLRNIYQKKIDADCQMILRKAKITWESEPNPSGADKSMKILEGISPLATCDNEVNQFIENVTSVLKAANDTLWKLNLKEYLQKLEIQKENIQLQKYYLEYCRDIAIEYARNQPQTVNYNNIYWR